MAKIVIPDHLLAHTQGARELDLQAADFRELLAALDERFPGSQEIFSSCAVAIDGQIYQDAFIEPLNPDSEVFFMQRIEGG
jgi:molybdopterin synthase sulfur carrier subunit